MDVSVVSVAGMDIGDLEIYAAIDMSAPLGLAADATARRDLEALTSQYLQSTPSAGGCAFACHQRDGWEPSGLSSYQMAKNARIPLREDVLKAAFGSFVDSFMDPADPMVSSNHKRMAVIGFSDQAQVLTAPTNDTATIKSAPGLFPEKLQVNTKFENAMPFIRTTIGQQGSGMNGSPKKTLLLITDGLRWVRNGGGVGDGPQWGPLRQFQTGRR